MISWMIHTMIIVRFHVPVWSLFIHVHSDRHDQDPQSNVKSIIVLTGFMRDSYVSCVNIKQTNDRITSVRPITSERMAFHGLSACIIDTDNPIFGISYLFHHFQITHMITSACIRYIRHIHTHHKACHRCTSCL